MSASDDYAPRVPPADSPRPPRPRTIYDVLEAEQEMSAKLRSACLVAIDSMPVEEVSARFGFKDLALPRLVAEPKWDLRIAVRAAVLLGLDVVATLASEVPPSPRTVPDTPPLGRHAGEASELRNELERWRAREWATVHERAVWLHGLGQHADAELPVAFCPLCEMEHPRGAFAAIKAERDRLQERVEVLRAVVRCVQRGWPMEPSEWEEFSAAFGFSAGDASTGDGEAGTGTPERAGGSSPADLSDVKAALDEAGMLPTADEIAWWKQRADAMEAIRREADGAS